MKIVSLKEIWREKCTEKKELVYSKEYVVNPMCFKVFLGQAFINFHSIISIPYHYIYSKSYCFYLSVKNQ